MRYLTTLAITTALVGAAVLFASRTAAAAPHAGGSSMGAQVSAQSDVLIVQTQAPRGQRAGQGTRGGRRAGGGGGGGGNAAAAAGIAGGIIAGIIAAEEARAAADQEAAIAQCARRYRSYDPQTQTYIGRGGQVYNCP